MAGREHTLSVHDWDELNFHLLRPGYFTTLRGVLGRRKSGPWPLAMDTCPSPHGRAFRHRQPEATSALKAASQKPESGIEKAELERGPSLTFHLLENTI
jgi:hypothetical protein